MSFSQPRKLGKREARIDGRVPRFSIRASSLPPPPVTSNWYAKVANWGMLGNSEVGDCVEAAILHMILQITSYAGDASIPTESEAIQFYSLATGYVPGNAATDRGSYVLGSEGVMEYWLKNGVMCGGVLNKPSAYMQITRPNPIEWRQSINLFGSLLIGMQVPSVVADAEFVPDVWSDFSGPSAGGHEVLLVGYDATVPTEVRYDLISWGKHYRVTEAFLLHVVDEAVSVYDAACLNKMGVNAAGIEQKELLADMVALRSMG